MIFLLLFFSLFLRNEKLEAEAKSATEKFEEVSSCFVLAFLVLLHKMFCVFLSSFRRISKHKVAVATFTSFVSFVTEFLHPWHYEHIMKVHLYM